MRRGEVWWADLPAPMGRRPVLLASRDPAYAVRDFVMVAPVTTRIRGIPAEVPLGPAQGLARPSVANADSLVTIPKRALTKKIAALSGDALGRFDDALRFALGLPK
ncbi:MAG: type II toxin-antitoxin system PemK/MazF family toxin [Planctomycetales bacterium]|nr:type II toxin-antitoxin system PemK/MazF family toxin [Planctomycetales bacterium]